MSVGTAPVETVIVAVAVFVGSAEDCAVSVTVPGEVGGAVYRPLALTVPRLAAVAEPLKLHETAVFVVPLTVAVN